MNEWVSGDAGEKPAGVIWHRGSVRVQEVAAHALLHSGNVDPSDLTSFGGASWDVLWPRVRRRLWQMVMLQFSCCTATAAE